VRGEDRVIAAVVVPAGAGLSITSGKRTMGLKGKDLEHYAGSRASRGLFLPQGYRTVALLKADTGESAP
jgi:topoisomerase IV subunit A